MSKTKALVSVLLICSLFLLSMGCVDTGMLKKWTVREKRYKDVYEWEKVVDISHKFHTNITGDMGDATYRYSEGFDVPPRSDMIRMQIDIDMEKINDPGEIPPWLEPVEPIIENLTEIIRNIRRHVDITLKSPGQDIFWYGEYNNTQDIDKQIVSPVAGDWLLDIDAEGLGFPQVYQDSLHVVVSVRQYKGQVEI